MIKAKILGKWQSPSEDWLRKHAFYTDEELKERIKLTYSIYMECAKCEANTWQLITTAQEKSEEPVECLICKELNFI